MCISTMWTIWFTRVTNSNVLLTLLSLPLHHSSSPLFHQPRQSIPRGCVRQERKDAKRVRMSLCEGFTLLRFEDNKRGICGDPGQEQPPRSRSEHPLHSLSIPLQRCRPVGRPHSANTPPAYATDHPRTPPTIRVLGPPFAGSPSPPAQRARGPASTKPTSQWPDELTDSRSTRASDARPPSHRPL